MTDTDTRAITEMSRERERHERWIRDTEAAETMARTTRDPAVAAAARSLAQAMRETDPATWKLVCMCEHVAAKAHEPCCPRHR